MDFKDSFKSIRLSMTVYRHRVLLVDDQKIIGEAIRQILADCEDVDFVFCQNPKEAIELAKLEKPTVILQDLVMPEMDGMLLLSQFKHEVSLRDIPLIILSTKEDAKIKAEVFALGASDYLVKIPDRSELIARVRYHSQNYIRILERNEAFEKLAQSRTILLSQFREAADYVTSFLPKPISGKVKVNWNFIPSIVLGGDAFGYTWLTDDAFIVFLLDVCGHGVGAALLSVSVLHSLLKTQLTGVSFYNPAEVLSKLNEIYYMESQNNMFFTIWYGVYVPSKKEMTFCSAGHPPALLKKAKGNNIEKLHYEGTSIGIMEKAVFENQVVSIDIGDQLFIFSDGVFEFQTKQKEMWRFQDLVDLIQKNSGEDLLPSILHHSQEICLQEDFEDDYSIIQCIFN